MRRPSFHLASALLALMTPLVGLSSGCSDSEEPRTFGAPGAPSGTGGEPTPVDKPPGGPCMEGATKECSIDLGEHEGVKSCFAGVKVCHNGVWGPCGADGSGQMTSLPWPPAAKPLALGPEEDCTDNPCDPACQEFDEQPDSPIQPAGGGSTVDWQTGSIGNMPSGLVNKGLKQPCSTASDCQFDHYCSEPTQSTCGHPVCETGGGLDSTCSPCAEAVCAADPTCCTSSYGGSCDHDRCEIGGKLKKNCDSCVKAICNEDSYCCNTFWDELCVDQVATVCGKTCSGGAGVWDASCVDKVHDVCGAFCGSDPAATSGECKPWLPTQKDAECAGVDLTAGVPCDGSIPVCNRGTVAAPAGVKLVHFPGNSQQYPKSSPSLSHPQTKYCTTSEPIPPGTCIDVTSCSGLNGNREVMVNPPGAGQIAECNMLNNWTLYSGGSCAAPTCSAVKSEATFKKVSMFVAVDKSGSMEWNGWTASMNALKSFFGDPASEGLGVALRFWPDSSPSNCSSSGCSINNCSDPLVKLGTLTAASSPSDSHEKALINAINSKSPGGGTPMYAALGGATKWATSHAAANPNEQAVVVLVTDGQPTECGTNVNNIAGLASDAYAEAGVLTYVIGIELDSDTIATVNQIAFAGGTGQAFLVPMNNGPNSVNAELVAALNAIKGEAVDCEFDLPNEGQFDPSNVKMTYTPTSGAPVSLPQVAGVSSCMNGGWYYDVPNNPSKATLCSSTCGAVQADSGAKVEIEIGCPGAYAEGQFTQVYGATCPTGTKPQWGYLSYDTYTPGDSSVTFIARTSETQAGLASAAPIALATAQAAPDTQVCNVSTGPGCPVDMFVALGGLPKARHQFIEVTMDMVPTSSSAAAPLVNDWKITYSCPYSE